MCKTWVFVLFKVNQELYLLLRLPLLKSVDAKLFMQKEMIFIRDIKKKEKVKYIQVDPISSQELGIILEKYFIVEEVLSEDNEIKSNTKGENSEEKSKADF